MCKKKDTIVLILKILQSELAAVFLHYKLISLKHNKFLKEKKSRKWQYETNKKKKIDGSNNIEISISRSTEKNRFKWTFFIQRSLKTNQSHFMKENYSINTWHRHFHTNYTILFQKGKEQFFCFFFIFYIMYETWDLKTPVR